MRSRKKKRYEISVAISCLLALTASAIAHPGHHGSMGLDEFAAHLASPWHIGPVALVALVAGTVAVFLLRRRKLERSKVRSRR